MVWGDLNFLVVHENSLGSHAHVDSLTDFFEQLLDNNKFIDIEIALIQLKWINQIFGDAMLARHLDRFLIKEPLMDKIEIVR